MRRSIYSLARAVSAMNVATISTNTTTKGTTIDLHTASLDASRSAMAIVYAGAVTDGTYALKLQHSDTTVDGDFTDVTAEHLQGAFTNMTGTSDNTFQEVGYVGPKRYIRVVITSTSVTSGGTFGAFIIRGFTRRQPIAHS